MKGFATAEPSRLEPQSSGDRGQRVAAGVRAWIIGAFSREQAASHGPIVEEQYARKRRLARAEQAGGGPFGRVDRGILTVQFAGQTKGR